MDTPVQPEGTGEYQRPRITMEDIGLDPNTPLGRKSRQSGGRQAKPKEPIPNKNGSWTARFYHPLSGEPTIRTVTGENAENDARAICTDMFDLWIANGKPQADPPSRKPLKKPIKAQAPKAIPEPQPIFSDPLLKSLFGKDLTVTMIGVGHNGEPVLGLRNGSKETFVVRLVERTQI